MTDRVAAVFFDLDGTLVRDGAADAATEVIRALTSRHPELDREGLRTANREVWARCWVEHGERWARGELPADAVARGVWRLTFERIGGPEAQALLTEAVALHLAAEQRTFTPFDETRSVLEELRRRGIPLGVITNGPSSSQREKLRLARLDHFFELVVASGDIGVLKPDPAIFAHALRELGVRASASVHVGDNFTADIAGATDAGLRGIWINRDGAAAPRDDVAHHAGPSLDAVLRLTV